MSKPLEVLHGIDIYLLDQIMKDRLRYGMRILDAGCGYGRNVHWLLGLNYDVHAIDVNPEGVNSLRSNYSGKKKDFQVVKIENYKPEESFDFIICNAVLHFADGHAHFEAMFRQLVRSLEADGTLFIRMTSNIGLEDKLGDGEDGVYALPDGSVRYLLTRAMVDELIHRYTLKLLEPVKTVFVDGLRSMTTLVFSK